MDLRQTKLTKTEWSNTEIPVSDQEKLILKMIIDGYRNVNIRINTNQSMFQIMKIEFTPENELFLYKKYFEKEVLSMIERIKRQYPEFVFSALQKSTSIKQPKKVDILRIEHMDKNLEHRSQDIFEFVLLDLCKKAVQSFVVEKSDKYAFYLYTLIQLIKNSIQNVNKYVCEFVNCLIQFMNQSVSITSTIRQAYEYIEKNSYLLKYEDMTLFTHQKQLFSIMRESEETPKLVLYIAPTGTGKTLSPLGLSEQYRVIFICVARHVGLALAKSAISVGKKVAFAFGCETASDIRLHYFAASNYTINKRSGAIGKVDNSVGDKVEIMICDVQSYLTAMYYMLAFNSETDIVTYWDEPTITLDYPTHELHQKIHENWKQNKISKMVLSCATLPRESEIQDTLMDFRCKFANAEIYTIESYDCRKSISLLNKDNRAMLPHTIPEFSNYEKLMEAVEFCEANKTLLRYFDLSEIVRYIEAIHKEPGFLEERWNVDSWFSGISEITMNSIKLYYLETFKHLIAEKWREIHESLMREQVPKFVLTSLNSNKTNSLNGAPIRKTKSVQIGSVSALSTTNGIGPPGGANEVSGVRWDNAGCSKATGRIHKISSLGGDGISTSTSASSAGKGILLTTSDAYTLTDGPTIFLAEDVEKIGKFYIQYSKIPSAVFDRIMEKIEKNNEIQKQLNIQEQKLEDKRNSLNGGNSNSSENTDNSRSSQKDRREERREEMDPEIRRLTQTIENLRNQIHAIHLDSVYVPNSATHQMLWTNQKHPNAFMPNIEDSVVKEIMELAVDNTMKVLLLLGIGMFTNSPNTAYMEIMKRLAYEQKLYLIIASSDYIYGTNYSFCHGFIGKDLQNMTQQKIIQALGRVGRNKVQQEYTVRFRDDTILMRLFQKPDENLEADNMNRLFTSD